MNIKSVSNLMFAALVGSLIGYYAHALLSQSMQTTLAIGQFSTRLSEDSATLAQLKRNDISCIKSDMTFRVQHGIEQAAFYQKIATDSAEKLKLVNDALQFAKEILATPDQVASTGGKPCS